MRYDVTNYEIQTKKVKNPLRFAVLADIHWNYDDEILDIIDANSVDGVLIPGDFVHQNTPRNVSMGVAFLKKLCRKYKVFYAFGNHEERHYVSDDNFCSIQNLFVLRNHFVVFRDIAIGGIRENSYNAQDFQESLSAPCFTLVLVHRPSFYSDHLNGLDIDLAVAGHTHGGQIRVFNHGLYSPDGGFFPPHTGGIYDNKLVVSRGLCNTAPKIPRINNRQEIVFITILPNGPERQE